MEIIVQNDQVPSKQDEQDHSSTHKAKSKLVLQLSSEKVKNSKSLDKSETKIGLSNIIDDEVSNFTDDFDNEANYDSVENDCASDDNDDSEGFSGDDGVSGNTNDDTHWRQKPVVCPICSKPFSKHSGVKLHLKVVHTALKLYPCFICAHVSLLSTGRIKHIAKKHPEEILKKKTCKICGIRVKTNSSYQRHLRKHETDRQCRLCNVELDSIEALDSHKKTVHQEEPPDGITPELLQKYSCHHCENVSFWKEADWKAHYIDVHNTQDVFPCNLCEKAFRNKSLLGVHKRVHTGEKPYMCEQCATRFSSKESLRNHM